MLCVYKLAVPGTPGTFDTDALVRALGPTISLEVDSLGPKLGYSLVIAWLELG